MNKIAAETFHHHTHKDFISRILVSLAKDLREDFYPHFPRFLDILIKLLKTKDAERLEWTLVCLAFLFKTLKPYLKKDIAAVLKRIIPLLSESQPQYVNNFAAESFAFVARDIRDKKKFIELVLSYLQDNNDVSTLYYCAGFQCLWCTNLCVVVNSIYCTI